MSIALRALPASAQDTLRTTLPAHVDPAQLGPEDAFIALWQAGYFTDGARAWAIVQALARAELIAGAARQVGGHD